VTRNCRWAETVEFTVSVSKTTKIHNEIKTRNTPPPPLQQLSKVKNVYVKNREYADSSLVLEPTIIITTYMSHANDYFSQMKSPTVMTVVRVCMHVLSVAFTIFTSGSGGGRTPSAPTADLLGMVFYAQNAFFFHFFLRSRLILSII